MKRFAEVLGRNAAMKLMLQLPAAVEVDTIPGRRSLLLGRRNPDSKPSAKGTGPARRKRGGTLELTMERLRSIADAASRRPPTPFGPASPSVLPRSKVQ